MRYFPKKQVLTRRTITDTFNARGKRTSRLIVETHEPQPSTVKFSGRVRAPGTARVNVTTT